METPRLFAAAFAVVLLVASSAFGQVSVTAHLEKAQYLQGEPVVVVLEALNIGTEPLFEGGMCVGDIRLEIAGARPRDVPRLFGCPGGVGVSCSGGPSHAPQLAPGNLLSSRVLLADYDLPPGSYQLIVSGQLPLRWPNRQGNVPGVDLAFRLSLEVIRATAAELEVALAPLVADAQGPMSMRSVEARAAILESAPPFLADVIARFSPPYAAGAVAEALRRIGTPASRALLIDLYDRTAGDGRGAVVLALAKAGDPDLADLLARILNDPSAGTWSRRYAALGLGLIGGERGVRDLERALTAAQAELRDGIATALGHTRSTLAVPVLIGMFSNNDAEHNVCNSLRVLTHRRWCESFVLDPAAQRRKWLRSWASDGASATIYGLDSCQALEDEDNAASLASRSAVAVPEIAVRPSGRSPKIASVVPSIASAGSWVTVSGHSLGADSRTQRVLFIKGTSVHVGQISGGNRAIKDGVEGEQDVTISVPDTLEPGQWQLVIDANGRRTPPVTIQVRVPRPIEWQAIWPARPHPFQMVQIDTRFPPQRDDQLELIDARGVRWPFTNPASNGGFSITLAENVAEGEAVVRVLRKHGQADSPPVRFSITSGPSPLMTSALEYIKPVAAGQWTDMWLDAPDEFEVQHVDRVELEFTQKGRVFLTDAAGGRLRHVQIPIGLRPGNAMARNRTWIGNTASEWSPPVRVRIAKRAVPTSVDSIVNIQTATTVSPGDRHAPRFIEVQAGDQLDLYGRFPVAQPSELRVQLTSENNRPVEIQATSQDDSMRIQLPAGVSPGDWQLRMGPVDQSTTMKTIAVLRVK